MTDIRNGDVLFDAHGNDRSALMHDVLARLDQVTGQVAALSHRIASLERLTAHDEVQLAAEIEALRGKQ